MKITGAIFDMDGTLLDSMDYWAVAPIEYLNSIGVAPKENTSRYFLEAGMKEWYKYQEIPLSFDEVSKGVYDIMEKYYFSHVNVKDGVYNMLKRLKSHGVKICLATATDRDVVEKILEKLGLTEFFLTIFTTKEIGLGKRFPLIYEKAREFLGTDKETTYVFEDAYYAINTCHSNGINVVGVYDKNIFVEESEIISLCNYYLDKDSKYEFDIE